MMVSGLPKMWHHRSKVSKSSGSWPRLCALALDQAHGRPLLRQTGANGVGFEITEKLAKAFGIKETVPEKVSGTGNKRRLRCLIRRLNSTLLCSSIVNRRLKRLKVISISCESLHFNRIIVRISKFHDLNPRAVPSSTPPTKAHTVARPN